MDKEALRKELHNLREELNATQFQEILVNIKKKNILTSIHYIRQILEE